MISVVVVSHDSGPQLLDCLASIEAEAAAGPLELILVDNASADGWPARAAERFSGLRLLAQEENLGFGAAVNRGAAAARGETLLLLNPDARLAAGALPALAARLAADPRLGVVAPRLSYLDGRLQTVWAPDPGLPGEAVQRLRNRLEGRAFNHGALVRLLRALLGPGWLTAACVLVRRKAFDAVGGFDEGYFLYFEDADLGLRLRRAGWRSGVEPDARAVHAKARQRRGGRVEVEYRRSQLRYYALHRPRWERALLRRHLASKYRRQLPDETARAVLALLRQGE